jgi:hypothetical protein
MSRMSPTTIRITLKIAEIIGSVYPGLRPSKLDRRLRVLRVNEAIRSAGCLVATRANPQNKVSGSRRRGDTREQVGGKPRQSALRRYSRRMPAGPAGRLRAR